MIMTLELSVTYNKYERMNMKQIIIKITQWITLILIWLIISPLFVYLAKRWNLIGKKIRILLLLISPLMLIVYFILFLLGLQGYDDYQRKYKFANNETVERITGVAFPELDIVEYKKDNRSFLGDYNDKLILEMEEELGELTYHYLDSIINAGNTEWSKHDDEYSYSIIWGNGFPAPKGEDDEEDMMFSLSTKKGSKIITIEYGAW